MKSFLSILFSLLLFVVLGYLLRWWDDKKKSIKDTETKRSSYQDDEELYKINDDFTYIDFEQDHPTYEQFDSRDYFDPSDYAPDPNDYDPY